MTFQQFCYLADVRESQVLSWRLVRWESDGVKRRELVTTDGRRYLECPDGGVKLDPQAIEVA